MVTFNVLQIKLFFKFLKKFWQRICGENFFNTDVSNLGKGRIHQKRFPKIVQNLLTDLQNTDEKQHLEQSTTNDLVGHCKSAPVFTPILPENYVTVS